MTTVIYFRCERCAGAVRASDAQAGTTLACPHCDHANICPNETTGRSPLGASAGTSRQAPSRATSWLGAVRTSLAVVSLAAVVWAFWSMSGGERATPPRPGTEGPESAADQRQAEILAQAIDQPSDPALGQLFSDINARHFDGLLPAIPVTWEARLAQVGPLAADTFTLEGMFGHIGDKAIILLNTNLAGDHAALRRALSHEMVHAYLYTIGDRSTGHGGAFQTTLRRLADEGAFTGIVATREERDDLRAWLERESARLEADHDLDRRESEHLALEARELEQSLPDLNRAAARTAAVEIESWTLRRDAYNRRVEDLRARAERARVDLASFNEQVARYNLMLSYPDGLDVSGHVAGGQQPSGPSAP